MRVGVTRARARRDECHVWSAERRRQLLVHVAAPMDSVALRQHIERFVHCLEGVVPRLAFVTGGGDVGVNVVDLAREISGDGNDGARHTRVKRVAYHADPCVKWVVRDVAKVRELLNELRRHDRESFRNEGVRVPALTPWLSSRYQAP